MDEVVGHRHGLAVATPDGIPSVDEYPIAVTQPIPDVNETPMPNAIRNEADTTGGQDTAANIPGAELIVVPGVGHEMPLPVLGVFVDGILSAVARAKVSA